MTRFPTPTEMAGWMRVEMFCIRLAHPGLTPLQHEAMGRVDEMAEMIMSSGDAPLSRETVGEIMARLASLHELIEFALVVEDGQ